MTVCWLTYACTYVCRSPGLRHGIRQASRSKQRAPAGPRRASDEGREIRRLTTRWVVGRDAVMDENVTVSKVRAVSTGHTSLHWLSVVCPVNLHQDPSIAILRNRTNLH